MNNHSDTNTFPMHDYYLRYYAPYDQKKPDTPRFLVTMDMGIGDTVAVGLSAVDQIVENDPSASGAIDVLCNELQAQILACDPRINRIIETHKVFFAGPHITEWLRGIILDPEAARVVRFLRQRRYEAILPSVVAPGLYFRLHSPVMYPNLFELTSLFLFHRQAGVHLSAIVRHMVNRYFGKPTPISLYRDITLYLCSEHVQKAMRMMTALKEEASVEARNGKVLVIAPDTATDVTRPPIDLLVAALSNALATDRNLVVYILPSYTETTRSLSILKALMNNYAQRVFLMPAEPRPHLLDTAALIDQADIFVTGDTGVMHLAAAYKKLREGDDTRFAPKNSVKIIALFGGTNPNYFGYSRRSTIVGRGRKEQIALRPGFAKAAYHLNGRNVFDHITSQQVTNAILGV